MYGPNNLDPISREFHENEESQKLKVVVTLTPAASLASLNTGSSAKNKIGSSRSNSTA